MALEALLRRHEDLQAFHLSFFVHHKKEEVCSEKSNETKHFAQEDLRCCCTKNTTTHPFVQPHKKVQKLCCPESTTSFSRHSTLTDGMRCHGF